MTSLSTSRRVQAIKPAATLAFTAKAKALRAQGKDVLSFTLGEPDFDTPEPIKRAMIQAVNQGQTHYAPTLGDPQTREVVAAKLINENGIAGLTWEHVAISSGAKHSIFNVCQCLLDPDAQANEVILPVPAWVSYRPVAELAGGRIVECPTSPATGFKLTPDQLRRAITPRTRMLILNTPINPCGTMYSPEEIRALAEVVAEAASTIAPSVVVVTDEIYEKIAYSGSAHLSMGSIPSVAARTVTINGMSKAFAMTGWRVGYAAMPGEFGKTLIRAIDTIQGQVTNCIPAFIYPAIRAALTECAGDTARMRDEFARRAGIAAEILSAMPSVRCVRPTGAFYAFPEVSECFGRRTPGGREVRSSLDFAEALLAEALVAVVPGVEFGGCGGSHVRISFACSERDLREGLSRMDRFVRSLG